MPYNPEDMSLKDSPDFDGTKSDALLAPRNDDGLDSEGTKKKEKPNAGSKGGNNTSQQSIRGQSAF